MPDWIVKYWIEWIFGIVVAVLGGCYKHLSSKVKKDRQDRMEKARQNELEMKALKEGMRALLKRQLIEDCEEAVRKGWCEPSIKESIQDMGSCYKALGGNGIIPPMIEQVTKLPTFDMREHD